MADNNNKPRAEQRENELASINGENISAKEKHRLASIRFTDNAFVMFDANGKLKTKMSKARAKRLKERLENNEFDIGTFDGVPPTDLDWGV